jgi:PilZ domain-containing protein
MEHRWGQRFAVDIVVRLGSKPYAVRTGRLIDLSMSGGCIRIGMDLRMLSRVQVALVLPARFSQATPVLSAYVARRHRDGVGVEWCDFAPRAVVELLRSSALERRDIFAVRGAPDRTAARRSGPPRNMRHH